MTYIPSPIIVARDREKECPDDCPCSCHKEDPLSPNEWLLVIGGLFVVLWILITVIYWFCGDGSLREVLRGQVEWVKGLRV